MTTNAVYDEIEDELVRCLEQGAVLPEAFTITFAEDEFLALLAGGLQDFTTGMRVPVTTTRLSLKLAGYNVVIRSEKDPDDWGVDKADGLM